MMDRLLQFGVKKVIFLFACLVIVLILIIVLTQRQSTGYVAKTVNKDTGEVIYTEPNKTPERDQAGNKPLILGSYLLLDNGMTQAQFAVTKKILWEFSEKSLNNVYSELTLIPDGFSYSNNTMKTRLRLGQTGTLYTIEITVSELLYVEVKISDPETKTEVFSSGKRAADNNSITDQDSLEHDEE